MPKISVIAGAYNVKKEYASLAIESILAQTITDFEFIICDDGSTNETYEMIGEFSKKDKRITLIKNEKNMGLAYTLNHCLEHATGEYVARMDMDDISYPDRFEEQVSLLDAHPEYMLAGSWADLFCGEKNWGIRKMPEIIKKEDFLFSNPLIHPSVMMRREPLVSAGGYKVTKQTKRAEDYELFMRLFSEGHRFYNIQKPLIRFREDNDTYERRSYAFRLDEAKVRAEGFKRLGLYPKAIPYVIKPLVVGLIPQRALKKLRREGLGNTF